MRQEEVVKPFEVEYPNPGFALWQTEIPSESRLQIINSGDFPLETTLRGLGISASPLRPSFGICDANEIQARQDQMGFLLEEPALRKWLSKVFLESRLPARHEDFLTFNDSNQEHNPYWQSVHELLKFLEDKELPVRLRIFRNTLTQSLPLEETERQLAGGIASEIRRIAFVEGIAEYRIRTERGEPIVGLVNPVLSDVKRESGLRFEVFGYYKYSEGLAYAAGITLPNWIEESKIIGLRELGSWYYRRKQKKAYKKAYKPQQITSLGHSLIAEMDSAVCRILRSVDWGSGLEDYRHRLDGAKVFTRYRYGEKGLEIQIYGLEAPFQENNESFDTQEYEGFSRDVSAQMQETRRRYNAQVSRRQQVEQSEVLRQVAMTRVSNFFERWWQIDEEGAPDFTYEFKWKHLPELYGTIWRTKAVQALEKHREFVKTHLAMLQNMASIIDAMECRALQVNSMLCIPDIVEGQHVVAFRNLMPIHLLEENKAGASRLVPINGLPVLNGDMVGFTGFHGGGKTVASLTIPLDIYLAQSGLPTIGEHLRLNVKRALGMVFIERGKGSTCEILVEKLARVLQQALAHKGREVVLVLDELGSATQEISGLELGKDVLAALRQKGISVLFSTQILALAKHAETHLGAKCFKLDADHRISAGIADGGMSELRQRSGLDKLLVSTKAKGSK